MTPASSQPGTISISIQELIPQALNLRPKTIQDLLVGVRAASSTVPGFPCAMTCNEYTTIFKQIADLDIHWNFRRDNWRMELGEMPLPYKLNVLGKNPNIRNVNEFVCWLHIALNLYSRLLLKATKNPLAYKFDFIQLVRNPTPSYVLESEGQKYVVFSMTHRVFCDLLAFWRTSRMGGFWDLISLQCRDNQINNSALSRRPDIILDYETYRVQTLTEKIIKELEANQEKIPGDTLNLIYELVFQELTR